MRYASEFKLMVVAVMTLMALGGSASATTLTSPAGKPLEEGAKIKAESEGHISRDGTLAGTCGESVIEGEVTDAGGSGAPVIVDLYWVQFFKCGSDTYEVVEPGRFELNESNNGTVTVTWTGAEITLLTHGVFGTQHCIYKTNETDFGRLYGSGTTGETATLSLDVIHTPAFTTAGTPQHSACYDDVELTGSYKFTSPDRLYIDTSSGSDGTTLTSPKGTTLEAGSKFEAESEDAILWDNLFISCQESQIKGELENAGGSGLPTSGPISNLSFAECGKNTVTVLDPGSLEVYTDNLFADNNGTVLLTGTEIDILTHNLFGTTHCIFKAENTDFGTLTGSATTGGTATLDIGQVGIPQVSTDVLCPAAIKLTGSYKFTNPDYLDVD